MEFGTLSTRAGSTLGTALPACPNPCHIYELPGKLPGITVRNSRIQRAM